MPEIKYTFAQGKMNKDLDERIVPNGQYRNAENIQISTSDGSDVGTVQNILGNTKQFILPKADAFGIYADQDDQDVVDTVGCSIGSISDEKNDVFYNLVRHGLDTQLPFDLSPNPSNNTDVVSGIVPASYLQSNGIHKYKNYIFQHEAVEQNTKTVVAEEHTVVLPIFDTSSGFSKNFATFNETPPSGFSSIGMPTTTTGSFVNLNQFAVAVLKNTLKVGMKASCFAVKSPDAGFAADTIVNLFTETTVIEDIIVDSEFTFNGQTLEKLIITFNENYSFVAPNNFPNFIVFEDLNGPLNFKKKNYITGINIVDDLLFFTDGFSEPKKINIPRCIEGTINNAHTLLVNPNQNITTDDGVKLAEEHVTVIRKAPTLAPALELIGADNEVKGTITINNVVDVSDIITITLNSDKIKEGQILALKQTNDTNGQFDTKEADIRVLVIESDGFDYDCKILSIAFNLDITEPFFVKIDTFDKNLYKLKFPRFAFRYKYIDGEYSAFSPFSEIAFLPGQYDYSVDKGFNLGMENLTRKINVENIVQNDLPEDVKEIELLYKESNSPNIYKVTEFKNTDEAYINNVYSIETEHIQSILPSNQLLRVYDNVPRNALAQEITGSRIVYANYLQNYNFDGTINLNLYLEQRGGSFKSLKSIREYQVGIVYSDKYQRQSPVFSNNTGALKINKLDADRQTQLAIKNNTEIPSWAEYFKVFIKETSTEYYNLALDRYFDAKDGNVWLSFASSDRNKLDIDTSLILKKTLDSDELEKSNSTYKILAIENEAPEYVKTRKAILGSFENTNTSGASNVFINTAGDDELKPVVGNTEIELTQSFDNTLLRNFHEAQKVEDRDRVLYIRFIGLNAAGTPDGNISDFFEIDNVERTTDTNSVTTGYLVKFKKPLNDTVDFINTTPNAVPATYNDTTNGDSNIKLEVYQDIVQNKALFQGRFFVKIQKDEFIENGIVIKADLKQTKVLKEIKAFYAKDFSSDTSPGTTTFPFVTGGNKTSAEHATEIASYNTNHGNGVDIPTDAYASYYAWRSIYEILSSNSDNTSSSAYKSGGWIIDEAYAAGEEPFWGLANFDITKESSLFSSGGSTIFGKAPDFLSFGDQGGNFTTLEHQSETGNPFTGIKGGFADQIGLVGLGHGNNDSDFTFYSTGAGVTNNTIDISYVGPYGPEPDIKLERLNTTNYTGGNQIMFDDKFQEYSQYWTINDNYDKNARDFADNLVQGAIIRFTNDPNKITYRIKSVKKFFKFNYHDVPSAKGVGGFNNFNINQAPFSEDLAGWSTLLTNASTPFSSNTADIKKLFNALNYFHSHHNRRITFRLELQDLDGNDPDWTDYHPITGVPGTADTVTLNSNPCGIEVVTNSYIIEDNDLEFPENPAIFETEPKEDQDLEIYYEASDFIPTKLNTEKAPLYAPIGASVSAVNQALTNEVIGSTASNNPIVNSWSENSDGDLVLTIANGSISENMEGEFLQITNKDGSYKQVKIIGFPDGAGFLLDNAGLQLSNVLFFNVVIIEKDVSNQKIGLNWFNCYSFGNGVESDRIRDTFNSITIDNGAKASSTLDEPYEEQRRKYGLIFSGLYNSTSGVNNFNQFIQAEKITKDLNPTYGSIQKLFSRQTDLVAFCEDKVLKILANKDAVFNADGNPQLTANARVLGQTIPFVGDYGISKNPESFASYGYRAYFTDKQRGAVLRLSMDGLTPISNAGMNNYFRDNFKHKDVVNNPMRLLGGYDIENQAYDLTLIKNFSSEDEYDVRTVAAFEKTISYQEDVKGWTSFKSYIPEQSVSVSGSYFTIKNGEPWKHYTNVTRNNFYGKHYDSSFQVLLNNSPSTVKNYYSLGYEGTQSKIDEFAPLIPGQNLATYGDGEYYNITSKKGWYTEFITTDLQQGTIDEFIKKEGKWYNYIKGTTADFDPASFHVQGIGRVSDISIAPDPDVETTFLFTLKDVQRFSQINSNNTTGTSSLDDDSFTTEVHTENIEPGIYHSGNSIFENLRFDSFNILPADGFNIAASDFFAFIARPGFSSPGVLFADTNATAVSMPAKTIFLNNNPSALSPHGEDVPGTNFKCETVMRITTAGQLYNDYGTGQLQQLQLTELYPGVKEIFLIEEYDVETVTPGYRYPYPDRIRCEVIYTDGPNLGWTMPNEDFEILIDIKRSVPIRPI